MVTYVWKNAMIETIETVLTKTLIINEKEIEKIIRNSLTSAWQEANVVLYEKTIPASSVMGAIDDFSTIECKVTITTKETK